MELPGRSRLQPNSALLGCAALLAAALAGCGALPREDTSLADAAELPVTCSTREDCAAKWARARTWLAAHTARPIIADQTSMKTAPAGPGDRSPSFEVTISMPTATRAVINFSEECRGGCRPSPEQMLGDFNLYLSATDAPPLPPMSAPAKP